MVGGLVQIRDREDPMRSDTTLLVAALITLGIPHAGRDLLYVTCEAGQGEVTWEAVWSLREVSRCGRFRTVEMRKRWDDAQWLLANPTHPLALIRCGLTYERAVKCSPRFTLTELAQIETPDTWLEAAMRNLVFILRELPKVVPKQAVRFGPTWAAFVPANLPESRKKRVLNYVETRDWNKRRRIREDLAAN